MTSVGCGYRSRQLIDVHDLRVDWHRVRHQAGVFSRTQARAGGLSHRQIDLRVASGEFVAAHAGRTGVYMRAGTPWSHRAALWEALLSVGEPCALMGPTAASEYRWCDPAPTIWVVVPRGRSVRRREGIVVRRLDLGRADLATRDGLPLTSRPRTVADCLRFMSLGAASEVLDRSQQRDRVDLANVAQRVGSRGIGTRQARQLLAAADGTSFAAERLLASLLRQAGITEWIPNYRVKLVSRLVVIDVAFPRHRVAVEVDGFAFHTDAARFRDDRTRQNALITAGWVVLRFTWHDLVERPEAVTAEITAALGAAIHSR